MGKIVGFIANVLLWPIEKCVEALGRWMMEDEEDDGDNWPWEDTNGTL